MFTEEEWLVIEKAGFTKAVDMLNQCTNIADDKVRNTEMHTLRCMSIYIIGELLGFQLVQNRDTHPGQVMAEFFQRISNDIIPIAINFAKDIGLDIEKPSTVVTSAEKATEPIVFPEDKKLH